MTETVDAGLLGEHILATLQHAWKHLLVPNDDKHNKKGANRNNRNSKPKVSKNVQVYSPEHIYKGTKWYSLEGSFNICLEDSLSFFFEAGYVYEVSLVYVIVTNHVNWHMENLQSDREITGKTQGI